MRSFVLGHVDQFRRFFDTPKRGLNCNIRITNKSHHCPVCARPSINIEQRHAIDRLNRIGNLPNHILVAAFRKIRHTFD